MAELSVRPEDAAYKNPPLAKLNDAYREDDATRRGEVNDTVKIVTDSLQQAMTPGGRRVQKPVTAPAQARAAR